VWLMANSTALATLLYCRMLLLLLLLGSAVDGKFNCSGYSSPTISSTNGVKQCHESGELIFQDEFDDIDLDVWDHEITLAGGGNWEFQVYWNNRSNSYTRDSTLFLKPTLTSDRFGEEFILNGELDLWGGQPGDTCTNPQFYGCKRAGAGPNIINPIASARLRTANKFGLTYGRVEARAKMPVGDWIWPAIWMLPLREAYGLWPASGEIDILESRGNRKLTEDGVNVGVEQYGATLQYGLDVQTNEWSKAHWTKNNAAGYQADFHKFQTEWTPDYMMFSIDDEEIGRVTYPEGGMWEHGEFDTDWPGMVNPWEGHHKSAPFDREHFLILNVAVGGTGYFSDNAVNEGGKPWSNTSPQASLDFWNAKNQWYPTWTPEENNGENAAMQVDYIKVWAI